MALITCKDCKKEFSSDAKRCIHCGAKKPPTASKGYNFFAKVIIGAFVLFFIFVLTISLSPRTKEVSPSIDVLHAKNACEKSIKGKLNFPSTANFAWLDYGSYTAPNGNVRISLDFKAKNDLGAELPYKGECLITVDNKIETTITPR